MAPVPQPAIDAGPSPPDLGALPAEPTLRLPRNLVERGVQARLVIDPSATGFEGEIALDVDVAERSSRFWLHGYHLDVHTATLASGDAAPRAVTVSPRGTDLLELDSDTPVEPGRYKLAIAYAGRFDLVNTAGAFKQTVAGASYIYTQLEAVYARRVFPCVDEPDTKVPWQLALDVPNDLVAVSNTPVEQDTPLDEGHHSVRFQTTPPLPSYLVAFGVGPFEIVDAGKTKSGVPVRAITLHGRTADAAWAVKTTPRLLDELEAWFAVPYPYPKLDVLSVPLTVGFSAMENAGLVTFTESVMLLDAKTASLERKHRWVVTAAHELAHQWFGDDVTMTWWDDIWLNEGFADWLERKIAARYEPAWHDELGDLGERNRALAADALATARAVRQPIATADDILDVFDGITYSKGASVLGMFESYVGADAFQRGIRDYVRARAGGNAAVDDFIAAVSKVAGRDLGPPFQTFLDRPGAPELTASLACGASARLELAQHRYAPVGSPAPASAAPWTIPVCASYDRDGLRAQACGLLDGEVGVVALPASRCPRWVLANRDGRGYYHVALTARQSVSLRDEAWPELTPTERRAAFADVSDLARQGRLPLPIALSWLPQLLAAGDRESIGDVVALVHDLDPFVPDELRGKYELWLRLTFGPAATVLGILPKPGDDLDAESVRRDVVALALAAHDPELTAQAVKAVDRWRDLPQAVRGVIVAAAADASPEAFARLLRDARLEQDRAHRDEALGALASVRDLDRQRAAFALVLDPQLDLRETMWILLGSRDEANRASAREFFRSHKQEILARLPTTDTTGRSLSLVYLYTSTCDARTRDQVVSDVTETFGKVPGSKLLIDQAIEAMDQCIARRTLLEPEVRGWLTGIRAPKPKPKAEPSRLIKRTCNQTRGPSHRVRVCGSSARVRGLSRGVPGPNRHRARPSANTRRQPDPGHVPPRDRLARLLHGQRVAGAGRQGRVVRAGRARLRPQPARAERRCTGTTGQCQYSINNILTATLVGAFGLHLGAAELEFGASVPFVIMNGDRGPDFVDPSGNTNFNQSFGLQGQGIGDIGLHFKTRFLKTSNKPHIGLGVMASVYLPTTSPSNEFLGENQLMAQFLGILDKEWGVQGRFRIALNGGFRLRPNGTETFTNSDTSSGATDSTGMPIPVPVTGRSVTVGNEVPYGLGVAYAIAVQKFEVVAELNGAYAAQRDFVDRELPAARGDRRGEAVPGAQLVPGDRRRSWARDRQGGQPRRARVHLDHLRAQRRRSRRRRHQGRCRQVPRRAGGLRRLRGRGRLPRPGQRSGRHPRRRR